jgi:response regulator RpfG family c-di-GMP phosphodiesterase
MQEVVSCIFISKRDHDVALFKTVLDEMFSEAYCYTCKNGSQAIKIMEDFNLIPDLIFLELEGTELDAVAFLNLIRHDQDLKFIPVVVHSPTPQPNKVNVLRDSGASAIHFKPYNTNNIRNILSLYIGLHQICQLN